MSKYLLHSNFNGHFAGETITIPDYFDHNAERYGTKIEEKMIDKAPQNKAILSTPKNKGTKRKKK